MMDQHGKRIETLFDLALDGIERALEARHVIAAKGIRRNVGPDHKTALAAAERLFRMLTVRRPADQVRRARKAAAKKSSASFIDRLLEGRRRARSRWPHFEGLPEPVEPPEPEDSAFDFAVHEFDLLALLPPREDRIQALLRRGLDLLESGMQAPPKNLPKPRRREALDAGPDYPTALRAVQLLTILTAGRAAPDPLAIAEAERIDTLLREGRARLERFNAKRRSQ